jgi:integrase
MGKRANGEGSITRYKDGRWCGRYTVHTANGPRRKAVYGRTKAEVRVKLTKAMADADNGLVFDAQNLTIEEYLARWLNNSVRGSVKSTTHESYEQQIRKHINPALGALKLSTLSPAHVQGFYRNKLDEGLSARTVRYQHVILHKALKQALRWGMVPRNVTEAVDPPKVHKKEIDTLSPSEVRKLLEAARGERLEALYVLAVSTGLRLGELQGLKWQDIDLKSGNLSVRRTLSRTKAGLQLTSPKTPKSRRKIKLISMAVEALQSHQQRQQEEISAMSARWKDNGLVFCSYTGTFIDRHNVATRSFKPLLKRAGLQEIRFHDLRHTCATIFLSRGTHPKIVQELLGHANIAITLDTYSHVLPSMLDGAVGAMEDALS